MVGQGTEKADIFLLAFWCEIATHASARVEHAGEEAVVVALEVRPRVVDRLELVLRALISVNDLVAAVKFWVVKLAAVFPKLIEPVKLAAKPLPDPVLVSPKL